MLANTHKHTSIVLLDTRNDSAGPQRSRNPATVTQHKKNRALPTARLIKSEYPLSLLFRVNPFAASLTSSAITPEWGKQKHFPLPACLFSFLISLWHTPLHPPPSLAGDLSIKELWVTGCALVLRGTLKVRGWRHVRSPQDPALMTASCWRDNRRLNGWMDRWIEGRTDGWRLVVVAGKRAAPVSLSLPPL